MIYYLPQVFGDSSQIIKTVYSQSMFAHSGEKVRKGKNEKMGKWEKGEFSTFQR